ncbi:saccharopine dehydrogenase family protein [Aquirhabdus parva]|uniref:Saccharopine dehydrogenase n=1 Tax=Aquirhabdus parva TaxID=2283318 RepID=A0A345P9I3_9GAMM|nr:saccharopine dehydrogenase NADP-binding domain-containing protein [Aquirhabdus parva]AXI03942.1 saccharopine dehydrogenase [Aquirhabdus parva]
MSQRAFDIVLFGATGFTGVLTAEYLAQHAPKGMRWALAGRNIAKLEDVRARVVAINPAYKDLPILSADTSDAASLKALAESTKVVITTAGPFVSYGGDAMVGACATAGTHYCDITGEPEFKDQSWLNWHETAVKTGAKIVHSCGVDSIPHDLGVFFTVQQLPKDVPLRIEGIVGGDARPSGGTYHTIVTAMSRLYPLAKSYFQRHAREAKAEKRRIGMTLPLLRYSRDLKSWVLPFPTIDPQIVKHSANALASYGPDFRYGHFMEVKHLHTVVAMMGGLTGIIALAQTPMTKRFLLSLNKPGDGPSPEVRAKSWFRVLFTGTGGGKTVVTEVRGGDPGYDETAKMLAESAMCLAFDDLPALGGQLTTAVAMGEPLLARLQAAGLSFKVIARF